MNRHLRWAVPSATNLLLFFLITQANHYLAPVSLFLVVDALFLVFAGLHLRYPYGLAVVFATALFVDAFRPGTYGASVVLFSLGHLAVYSFRSRLTREKETTTLFVALGLNFLLLGGLAAFHSTRMPPGAEFFPRFTADLLASGAVLTLMAPWYFSLQKESLRLFGIDIDTEQREV